MRSIPMWDEGPGRQGPTPSRNDARVLCCPAPDPLPRNMDSIRNGKRPAGYRLYANFS